MFDERLKIAYTASNDVCEELCYQSDCMISTQEIINVVKKKYCKNLYIHFAPFDSLKVNCSYGAMMRTILDSDDNVTEATIVINSSKAPQFQRFSLVHELGHLVTKTWTIDPVNAGEALRFTISTHIEYDITNIKEEDYANSDYLRNEQIANIFALRVLMPGEQYYDMLKSNGDISEIAKFFGLNPEAVVSRAKIGA